LKSGIFISIVFKRKKTAMRNHLISFDSMNLKDLHVVSGKNASLGERIQITKSLGKEVPKVFALSTIAYQELLEANNLIDFINYSIKGLDIGSITSLQAVGLKIRNIIMGGKIPRHIEKSIIQFYENLSENYSDSKFTDVAIHSLANTEETTGGSFAGKQEAYLNVNSKKNLLLCSHKYMKKLVIIAITLFLIPTVIVSQTLQLGALSSFEAYSAAGAMTNSGIFTGDVGTDDGIISGFIPPTFTGTIHNNNALTAQAKIDILRVYIHLNNLFVTHPGTHAAAFGGGEIITPGIYSIPAAGSIGGTVTLDGGGDTNAVFIIKFLGAMTAGAGATTILSNKTQASNVFWIAEGAITVGAGSIIKGTLFSHGAAISLAANCNIEGRMFTTGGAISIAGGCVSIAPAFYNSIPIYPVCECIPAPTVDVLGSIEGFALFTALGAVTNTASSGVIGDIGTHSGTISGFSSSTHVGSSVITNNNTTQAAIDLDSAYIKLMALPNTVTGHAPGFGNQETLLTGVYYIAGAGSLGGTLTLDGAGDTNAIFIFKFAGAFSVAAQSKVIFTNGTNRCNVFWIGGAGVATGAISMGSYNFMKGTILSHGGACTSGAGGFIEGRMLSTAGAIGFSTGVIYNDPLCFTSLGLPIELLSFNATSQKSHVHLEWLTASEINNDYFTIERSKNAVNWEEIAIINGAGNSNQLLHYNLIDDQPYFNISYYHLKQTDFDGNYTYSDIKAININLPKSDIIIYPNPTNGQINIQGDKEEVKYLKINNFLGQDLTKLVEVISINETWKTLDLTRLSQGIYIIKTRTTANTVYSK
jgi:hypothetical protein